jgi:two-component system, NtrC family, nitrogen regulation response regulator NtrX
MTDGYDCPVVMMSGHGTVETAVEATRLGAFDFVEKPLSLTKLLRTVERALDAGRRKRLSRGRIGAALACRSARARSRRPCASRCSRPRQLLAGAAGRRARFRARGLRALPAFAERALRQAVFHGGRRELGRRSRGGAVRQRARRPVEPGAFDQAAGGTLFINGLEDLTAPRSAR